MAIDAVPGDIEDAILEPFDRNFPGREGRVLDLGEGLHPADAPGLFRPESVRIADRTRVHLLVFGLIDKGAPGPFCGHVMNLLGHFHSPPRAGEVDTATRILFLARLCVRGDGADKHNDYDLRLAESATCKNGRSKPSEWLPP